DHCGDPELREALGGAGDVAGFAFRLADPHVLVCAPVALPGWGGVRDDGRDSGGARGVDRDGPLGAVPQRARLDDAFLGEADAGLDGARFGEEAGEQRVNLAAAQLEEVYRARGRDLDERGQMALAFFESRPRLGIESDDAFLSEVGPGFFQVLGRSNQAYPAL